MKTILFSLAFLSLTCFGFAQEKGVQFQRNLSWAELKTKAKAEKKYIFIDVYATWCEACKEMDKNVYPSQNLGHYINEKFICVKVQMDQTNADEQSVKFWYKDAKQIVAAYKVKLLPTQLVLSPEGRLISSNSGYLNEDQLMKMVSESLEKKKPYYEKLEQFKQDRLSPSEMKELTILAKSFEEKASAQKVADRYINYYLLKLPESQLFNKENLTFIGDFLGDENSRAFQLFSKQSDKINEVLGDYGAQGKIMDFIDRKYFPQGDFATMDKPNWDTLEQIVVRKFDMLGQEIVYGQRMIFYLTNKKWEKFSVYYTKYFKMALKHSRYHINNISWPIFEHIDDLETLNFAIDVMKYSLENGDQNNLQAYDTYANLLYKAGRKNQAIEWEERAVRLSNQDKGLLETLEKMKNGIKTWPDTVTKP